MSTDAIIRLGSSVIQHGPLNDRVYLMKIAPEDTDALIPAIEALAAEHRYSKLFVKVPNSAKNRFIKAGYRIEARVPRMYGGVEDGWFLARYPDPRRAHAGDAARITDLLGVAMSRSEGCRSCDLPPDFAIAEAGYGDLHALAALYGDVFETYPFPIHDPSHLRAMMDGNTRYFLVRARDRVVAAASAETNPSAGNVEMTDFATHPAFRGMGLCSALLSAMEEEMGRFRIRTSFTIARAAFYPINVTFARAGYRFGGTLVNNTNICGAFESMNVWYRFLDGETPEHGEL
jgi:putative beta-lysine N-acetyltransferase